MDTVKTINTDNFEKEVLQSELPVLIDFWAPWCMPCKMVGPIIEHLADDYADKITVGKINVDENQNLAVQFGVRGIPTLLFFKDGVEVKRIVGAQGGAQLQAAFDEVIG